MIMLFINRPNTGHDTHKTHNFTPAHPQNLPCPRIIQHCLILLAELEQQTRTPACPLIKATHKLKDTPFSFDPPPLL